MSDPRVHPPNPIFEKIARVVIGHRLIFLALTLAFTGTAAYFATQLKSDTSIEAFTHNESRSQQVLEAYRDQFGRDDVFLLLVEGDVFTLDYLQRLEKLHRALESLDVKVETLGHRRAGNPTPVVGAKPPPKAAPEPAAKPKPADDFGFDAPAGDDFGFDAPAGDDFAFDDAGGSDDWGGMAGGTVVEEVTSLINVRRTTATPDGQGIRVGRLMEPLPTAAALPTVKAEVLGDAFLVGQVVGRRGQHSVVVVRAGFMSEVDSLKVNAAINTIADGFRADDFVIHSVGLPALNSALNELMLSDMGRLTGLAAIILVFLMGFIFRHPLGIIGPLGVVGQAVITTFGLMGAAGITMTMMSTILPAFIACVGIGDSVHLLSVYRDYLREGLDRREAAIQAIATTGTPIFYTTLTTMVGLLSFRFASLEAIQDMGTAGAFGVAVAMVHSLIFLPVLVSFTTASFGAKPKGEADFLDRFINRCLSASIAPEDSGTGAELASSARRRRRTLVVGTVLLVAAIAGMSTLRVYHNPFAWIPDDKPIKIAFEMMDDEVGGTSNVVLLIEGSDDHGVRDRRLLVGLEKLREHIQSYTHPEVGVLVGNALSVVDIVKETNRALHGGDEGAYQLPAAQGGVNDAMFLFSNAGPTQLRRLASTDFQLAQMTLRIRWLDATGYEPLTKHVEAGIAEHIPAGAGKVEPTGSVYTLVTTIRLLLGDLMRSFGVAFLVITLIMIVLLRGAKLGLVAMVPNLMPIVFIMGLMGFANVPIDMNTLLIASIAIGVAVDDTIHFLHHFRVIYAHTGDAERAIRRAARHSGRAMCTTTIALMLGFSAYGGSEMANIQRFGLLIALTCAVALLIDLVFAPALLRTIYRPRGETT